ncbi:hypothetical protein THII_3220 [Thioploca ingrica]|uniref:Secreted protein n=1 Tax=Thioploca ingrica TaxID=40754 RepID=A0A090AN71_9GAMM|nr:hypothetical protein THII_3220 [Thioploca ingrica]
MNQFNKINFNLVPTLWLTMMLFFSSNEARSNSEFNNTPSTEVETLGKLINLPFHPTQVIWQVKEMTSNQPESFGPKDWMLFALLTFEETHFRKILEQSPEQLNPEQSVFWNAEYIFAWFPPTLKEKLVLEGEKYRWSIHTRTAKIFTKSPLLQGYFVPLGDHFQVFLFLYTM